MALCVWVLAIWLAFKYAPTVEVWLQSYIHDKTMRWVAAFVAILLSTVVVGSIFNAILSFVLHRTGLSGTDRILGMGFGFVRGAFIVALLMVAVKISSIPHSDYSQQSRLYAKFDPLVVWLYGYLPDLVKHLSVFDKDTASPTKKHTTPAP
jgi:membrane protein required for colicin V production